MSAIRIFAGRLRHAKYQAAADKLARAVKEYLGEHDTAAKDYAYRHQCRERMRKALSEFHATEQP